MRRRYPDDLLAFLRAFRAERGYNASYRDIQARYSVASTSTAWRWLEAMEEDGLLTRTPARTRAYRLTPTHDGLALMWRA